MRPPAPAPDTANLLTELLARDRARVFAAQPTLPDGRYLHWDELRHRIPPDGLSREEWWELTRFARFRAARSVASMQRCYQQPFGITNLAPIQRALHGFDRANVGEQIRSALGNSDARTEYRVRQLIEEAISSSEIEGARPTTRELARQMLRENRPPSTRDERMIVNNLRAMERLRVLHEGGSAMTLADLLELHRILGEDALEVDGAAGSFRGLEHDVAVADLEGTVWHRPPSAAGLEQRVQLLLDFANAKDDMASDFLHPILRAIVAHFWLGYEHPFRDGNGRIARALYYWCMLRHGYDVAEFLSISGPIDRSPKAYYLAFAHTETDGGDLTYFVLHQLKVMQSALEDLLQHLAQRVERLKALGKLVASFDALNHRQRSLLEHAIRHPLEGQSIEGQATSHRVHYLTARADLADLEKLGLMQSRRVNKVKRYYPSPELLASTAPVRARQ